MLLSLRAPLNALPSTPNAVHAFVRLLNGPLFLNWVQWHPFSEECAKSHRLFFVRTQSSGAASAVITGFGDLAP